MSKLHEDQKRLNAAAVEEEIAQAKAKEAAEAAAEKAEEAEAAEAADNETTPEAEPEVEPEAEPRPEKTGNSKKEVKKGVKVKNSKKFVTIAVADLKESLASLKSIVGGIIDQSNHVDTDLLELRREISDARSETRKAREEADELKEIIRLLTTQLDAHVKKPIVVYVGEYMDGTCFVCENDIDIYAAGKLPAPGTTAKKLAWKNPDGSLQLLDEDEAELYKEVLEK